MANQISTKEKTKISTKVVAGTYVMVVLVVAAAGAYLIGNLASAPLLPGENAIDRKGLSAFSPAAAEKAGPNVITVNQRYSAGSNYSLNINDSISSLSVSGKVILASGAGLARIVLVDKNQKEYLVYETYPLLTNSANFEIDNICEETCLLDSVSPDHLRIEAADATLKLDKVYYTASAGAKSGDAETQRKSLKSSQDSYKINKINERIKAQGLKWTAGETSVSKMSYADKKKLFANEDGTPVSELPDLQGFEYYKGGIFKLKPTLEQQAAEKAAKSAGIENSDIIVPDSWDWRNVNGENWMTSVKDQGNAGNCWAFADLGAVEAQINLYYNNHVNVDLSEQIKIDCLFRGGEIELSDAYLTWITIGMPDEKCGPYNEREEQDDSPYCNYNYICSDWKERLWKMSTREIFYIENPSFTNDPSFTYINEVQVKKMLIEKGPLGIDIPLMKHAMVLEGYKTEKTTNKVIWIFKNSWGTNWGENGFGNMEGALGIGFLFKGPFTPPTDHSYWPAGFDNTIKCVDKDNDGYCNWGISETKPATCPASCNSLKDCDDSKKKLGSFISENNLNCCEIGKNCPSCIPNCVGKKCGSDGCGGSCGACSDGKTCSIGFCVPSQTPTCVPNCAGKTCGADDGCYLGKCRDCNVCACPTGQTCSGGACVGVIANSCTDSDGGVNLGARGTVSGILNGVPYSRADACVGPSSPTLINEYHCNEISHLRVGEVLACPSGQICDGTLGACITSCVPKTCAQLGKTCGSWNNGCGTNINCGSCPSGKTCSNGVCSCIPKTCAQLGKTCGSWNNGCGTNINCGTCASGKACADGICSCVPKTCVQLGKTCGSWNNGCGTNINCGTCAPASPTGVTANAGPDRNKITVTWHNPAGSDTVKIQRRRATGDWSTITTLSSKTTTYIDTGLSCVSWYKYRVIAHNTGGDSSPSSETALVKPKCY